MSQKNVTFDRPKLERFKREHKITLEAQKTSFQFDGDEYDVGYAKYLIEYLESKLPKRW